MFTRPGTFFHACRVPSLANAAENARVQLTEDTSNPSQHRMMGFSALSLRADWEHHGASQNCELCGKLWKVTYQWIG
jgi:hypothetical protein